MLRILMNSDIIDLAKGGLGFGFWFNRIKCWRIVCKTRFLTFNIEILESLLKIIEEQKKRRNVSKAFYKYFPEFPSPMTCRAWYGKLSGHFAFLKSDFSNYILLENESGSKR